MRTYSSRITSEDAFTKSLFRFSIPTILTRYILREFFKLFSLTILGLLCISILIELFEKIDDFIEYHASAGTIIEYFIFYTPRVLFYGAPMAVLLSTILTLGILSRNSEIVAMRAAGVSLYSVAIPILAVALLISLISFVFNESLVFSANQRMNYIKDVKIKKKTLKAFFQQNRVWMRGKDNAVINIDLLQPDGENFNGLTLYRFDDKFNLIERVDAKEARWDGARWIFINGKIRKFSTNGIMDEKEFDAIYYNFSEDPKDLKMVEKKSEEMNIIELYNYIQKLKNAGFNALRYIVDLHSKVSNSLVSFIVALFGIPFSFRSGRDEGIVKGIGTSIVIAIFFVLVFYIGISLGRAGIFPPFFAAWIGNLLFGTAGFYMLLSVKQ